MSFDYHSYDLDQSREYGLANMRAQRTLACMALTHTRHTHFFIVYALAQEYLRVHGHLCVFGNATRCKHASGVQEPSEMYAEEEDDDDDGWVEDGEEQIIQIECSAVRKRDAHVHQNNHILYWPSERRRSCCCWCAVKHPHAYVPTASGHSTHKNNNNNNKDRNIK